jgi:hypothetical protein
VEAYARALRPKLVLGRYKTETLGWGKTVDPTKYGLTMGGEGAAARLIRHLCPGTLTFFGPNVKQRFLLDQHLKTDPAGEVEILRSFWQFDNREPALTPTLLVYADLLAIGGLVAPDPERSRQALSAFLSGFNGHPPPF